MKALTQFCIDQNISIKEDLAFQMETAVQNIKYELDYLKLKDEKNALKLEQQILPELERKENLLKSLKTSMKAKLKTKLKKNITKLIVLIRPVKNKKVREVNMKA